MTKLFTGRWWTVLVLACFLASSVDAQTEKAATKSTTTTVKKTRKKPSKKKKSTKKTTKKTTAKKSTKTPAPAEKKSTPAPPSTPAPKSTPTPKSTPAPKPAESSTVDQSMRLAGSVTISGTSTLHSWTMTSNAVQGSAYVTTLDGELEKLAANTFIVPVRSLKSDNSSMNDNAYEALKEDKYKDIRFVLSSSTVHRTSAGHYTVDVSGNLTIAGVTKPLTSTLTVTKSGNSFTCTGSNSIRMTTFNVERPSFMLGAMKTGDEVTIKYNVTLQPR
jgi:polyisoprenoid-binding protein YceI